jgi:alanine racemase
MNDASTWVDVSTGALERNFAAVARHAQTPVCAVVKANAYGHGLVDASRVFARAGATMLGIARIEEARALRAAGIDAELLLMMPVSDVSEAVKLDCAVTAASEHDVAALPPTARVHLKVDTGMGRLGVRAAYAVDAARAVGARATLAGVWTHFADASASGGREQLARFADVVAALRAAGIDAPVHAANSAALVALPDARFDMVRVGTLLYGQHPAGARAPFDLEETFTWYARVAEVRAVPAGTTVGYGSEWRAPRALRIATIPIGYADGFAVEPMARSASATETARRVGRAVRSGLRRSPAERCVYFGDRPAPVVGRVAMQAITVSLEGLDDVEPGAVARIPARRLMVNAAIERIYR